MRRFKINNVIVIFIIIVVGILGFWLGTTKSSKEKLSPVSSGVITLIEKALLFPEESIPDYSKLSYNELAKIVLDKIAWVDKATTFTYFDKTDKAYGNYSSPDKNYIPASLFSAEVQNFYGNKVTLDLNLFPDLTIDVGDTCASWAYDNTKQQLYYGNAACGGMESNIFGYTKWVGAKETKTEYIVTAIRMYLDDTNFLGGDINKYDIYKSPTSSAKLEAPTIIADIVTGGVNIEETISANQANLNTYKFTFGKQTDGKLFIKSYEIIE